MANKVLSRTSKIEPLPNTVSHGPGSQIGYTCHMAAIHWAFMALGETNASAHALVEKYSRDRCDACHGRGLGGCRGIGAYNYGDDFCQHAQRIPSKADLDQMVQPGDILLVGHPTCPTHSMVVRQNHGPTHVTIRGFNNWGSLGPHAGGQYAYDRKSRNLAKDKYWPNAATGLFGTGMGNPLYVVDSARYLQRAQLKRMQYN